VSGRGDGPQLRRSRHRRHPAPGCVPAL